MRIHTELEAGRIEVVAGFVGDAAARLNILPDPGDVRFRQWFAFVIEPEAGDVPRKATTPRQVVLENASLCTWARGWKDYRVVASRDDGVTWFRIPGVYDGKALTIDLPASVETGKLFIAYYPPYPAARLAALLARVDAAGGKRRELVRTDSGLPVHGITLGVDDTHVPQIWVIAQQHPGEHMAGWFAEGFVDRLLTAGAPLLAKARVHVVPQMNPDGVARAQHRTNGAGLDQNRQWGAPAEKCPEVAAVRLAMLETGVDFFLDVHGDETIPYVFMQGTSAIPRRTTRVGRLEKSFGEAMLAASTDFQTEHAYPREKGRRANLSLAANWVANTFRALSFTLEMPFADNNNAPDLDQGWSPARTIRFAEATVQALGTIVGTAPRLTCPNSRTRPTVPPGCLPVSASEEPFVVVAPIGTEIPVVVEVPHASTHVPADALANVVAPAANLARDADLHVDGLYEGAPAAGATLIASRTSRYYVDLNRAETDLDAETLDDPRSRGQRAARGIVWRLSGDGSRILRRPLTLAELEQRLDLVYRPYHRAVAAALASKVATFGYAVLLAGHSMPSGGRTEDGRPRADVVPGTQGRTSAAARFIEAVDAHTLAGGLSLRHDDPYKGGYTTQHYGRPAQNVHVVQIELARRLYMNETSCRLDPAGFARMQRWCAELVARLGRT